MAERPVVSLITIGYNRPSVLAEFLDTVFRSAYRDIEVLLVNNSDEPHRREYEDVLSRFPGVVHLWNGSNLLISGALNRGIAIAGGELLLCCGDDSLFDSDMIGHLVDHMRAAPDVAVAGPVVLFADGSGILTAGHSISLTTGLPRNTQTPTLDVMATEIVDTVFMIRASALKDIGAFDEHNFPFYLESADLCMRARLRGYRCITVMKAKAWHKYTPLKAGVIPDPDRYGRNAITYYYLLKTKIRYIRKYSTVSQKLIFFLVFLPLLAVWHGGVVALKSKLNPSGKVIAILKGVRDGIFGRL